MLGAQENGNSVRKAQEKYTVNENNINIERRKWCTICSIAALPLSLSRSALLLEKYSLASTCGIQVQQCSNCVIKIAHSREIRNNKTMSLCAFVSVLHWMAKWVETCECERWEKTLFLVTHFARTWCMLRATRCYCCCCCRCCCCSGGGGGGGGVIVMTRCLCGYVRYSVRSQKLVLESATILAWKWRSISI